MTKKEIEERLQEEMHQNIPDKDALWQKIENRLPEQPVSQPVRRNIRMTSGSRFLTAVACFLLIVAGMRFFSTVRNLNQPEMTADNEGITQENNPADAVPEQSPEIQDNTQKQEILKYQNLNLPQGENLASQVNLSRLGTDGEYFSEDEILAKTDLFMDVRVLDGAQNPDSGKMEYTLQILDVYGGEFDAETITLETSSAYILEQNHEYVLPVTADCSLAYECAPQIEKTQDNKLVIPNGWYTLMQGETTPVLYDSIGKDDYFYDRMYLTGDLHLDLLIQKWQSL